MELNERKLNILKAIVKDYIETAEAVGSRSISKKHDLGVSAATIRNEMADLEELGYLIQPHTSAGRIPSQKGYRLYVDMLMGQSEISDDDKSLIKDVIIRNVDDIEGLIHETSKLLSQLTNYTTVAVTKNMINNKIKHIQLVSMNEGNILLIVVTDKGDIKKANLATNIYIDQSKLNIISDNITSKLQGRTISELDERFIAFIKYEISEYAMLIDKLINTINNDMSEDDFSISLSGATNILNYPEFNDILKARSFLNMLEKRDMIQDMIKSKGIEKNNVNIVIGSDNDCDIARDCSIVTATYKIDNDLIGKISFIGPTRMDYSRLYSIINYMSLLITNKK